MKHALLVTMLLALAGCKAEQVPDCQEITIVAHAGDDVNAMMHDVLTRAGGPVRVKVVYADDFYIGKRAASLDSLKGAHWDTVPPQYRPAPSDYPEYHAAAKVASVMAANDITLPQVAAYLQQYGWIAVPGPLPDIEWPASTPGTYPITHYVALLAVGVGTPTLQYYVPNAVGAKAALVAAVDNHGNISRISLAGWSDTNPAAALPGLQRFVEALDDRTIEEVER